MFDVKVRPLNRGARATTVSPRLAEVIPAGTPVYGVSLETIIRGELPEGMKRRETENGQVTGWMPVASLTPQMQEILETGEGEDGLGAILGGATHARVFVAADGSYWGESRDARGRYRASLPMLSFCGRELVGTIRTQLREQRAEMAREEREYESRRQEAP
jgi:hypothetical protein